MTTIQHQIEAAIENVRKLDTFYARHKKAFCDQDFISTGTDTCTLFLHDFVAVFKELGTEGWTKLEEYGDGIHWVREIEGVLVKLLNAEKRQSVNGQPVQPRELPLLLEEVVNAF